MNVMKLRNKIQFHLKLTWDGCRNWFFAQLKDAIVVGLLWWIGLVCIDVPLAPLWAILGALFQLIPILGTILALIGPALAAISTGEGLRLMYVFILYAFLVGVDGFILQPLFMKRTAKVPVWASILLPIALGFLFNIWAVLLAPPSLAVIYTYRNRGNRNNRGTSAPKDPAPVSNRDCEKE